jgi:hypothetical protein
MGVTLHPRTMKVNRAESELEEFLTWAEQHDLTWFEVARSLIELAQSCFA